MIEEVDNKKFVEYDARQEFTKDTNKRFTICVYYHEMRDYERLYRAANSLYVSVAAYFSNEERALFDSIRVRYYQYFQEHERLKRMGAVRTTAGYVNVYLPVKIGLMKLSDEFFECLCSAIHNNGLLLPVGHGGGDDGNFDLGRVFQEGVL